MIQQEDIRWLTGVVRGIYAARDFATLHAEVVPRIHRRFRAIISACESVGHDGTQFSADRLEGRISAPPDYHLYVWDNPNVIRLMDGSRRSLLHLRGAASRRTLERTEYYNVLARQNAMHDQLLTVVWTERRLTSFGLNRDRLFEAREKAVMRLLWPHLAAGIRRTNAHQIAWAPAFGQPWVELTDSYDPVALSSAQAALLAEYFPAWECGAGTLPPPLREWLRDTVLRFARDGLGRPLHAFQVEAARGRLGISYYFRREGGGGALRLTEIPAQTSWFLTQLRLSPRETDVLGWLAQGKRDAEIAAILGIATKTVSKHVENILRKMGANSRTDAARTTSDPIGGPWDR